MSANHIVQALGDFTSPAMRNLIDTLLDAWMARRAVPPAGGLAPAVVVTGGSRGIGLAIAERFAAAGRHAVVLVARGETELASATAAIRSRHTVRVLAVSLDVTRPGAGRIVEDRLAADGLYVEVLVNSAGTGLSGAFTGHDATAIDALVALNITALARLMRHVLPGMQARRHGGVINVASLGGYVPGPCQALYYASKAAVISLSEAVAAEMAGTGVRVTVVAPGPSPTGFHAGMGAENALYRRVLPAMSPERIARSAYRGFVLGRRVIVPGVLNTAAAWMLRVLPHALTVPIVARLLHPCPNRRNT